MAGYISQLRRASFRGISFEIPSAEAMFGRRVVTDELPGRDTPVHEDMGAATRRFVITAIIAGDYFLQQSKTFEDALNTPGAGELIHPYYGEMQVIVVGQPRAMHDGSAVGVIRYSIEFEKDEDIAYPAVSLDTLSGLSLSADNLLSALRGDFVGRFVTDSLPDFISADAIKQASRWVSTIETALSSGGLLSLLKGEMPSGSSIGLGIVDDVTSLFGRISDLVIPAKTPVVGSAAAKETKSAVTVTRALNDVVATTAPDVTGAATSTLSTRQKNETALECLFRGVAAATIADVAMYADYESKEEALAVRAATYESLSALRDLYGKEGWFDSWKATAQVMAAVQRDINDRVGRLPRTVRVRMATVRSSLVVAHRFYGDDLDGLFSRADDIVRRNRVRHPGFVPVRQLEVLID